MKSRGIVAAIIRFFVRSWRSIFRAASAIGKLANGWFRSRRWSRLCPGAFPLIISIVLSWSLLAHRIPGQRERMIEDYRLAAQAAAESGDVKDYRLNFRRMLEISGGGPKLRFEFASTLYSLGEEDEALRMMSGLAPVQTGGYPPAHRFLASHLPAGQSRQIDLIRAVHLSHIVSQNSSARAERLELVSLLAKYKNYDRAEKLLRPTLDKFPEDCLTIARLKVRAGNIEAGRSEARRACEVLRPIVAREPGNLIRRLQLAQSYVFLAEPDNSLKVLLKALPESVDPPPDTMLLEAITTTLGVWLSLMPAEKQTVQRECLRQLAALAEASNTDDHSTTANGADVASAPDDRQFLSEVMQSPRRQVVVLFLEGTIAAAEGNWSVAEQRLRSASDCLPDDPSINNNLAWILAKSSESLMDKAAREATLNEASLMSARSIDASPDVAAFHETYAQVLAMSGRHSQAIAEWEQCLSMGLRSRHIHKSLAASLNILGKTTEAQQHELESRNAGF